MLCFMAIFMAAYRFVISIMGHLALFMLDQKLLKDRGSV